MDSRRMTLDTARRITLTAMFSSVLAVIVLGLAVAEMGIDLTDPTGWLLSAPPEQAAIGLIVLVTAVLALWLAVTTFGYAGARARNNKLGLFAVTRFTPRVIRRAVDTVAAVSIAVASLGPSAAASADTGLQWNPAVVRDVAPDERPRPITPPGIHHLGYAPTEPPADEPEPTSAPKGRRHNVITGENLWRIACRQVGLVTPRPDLHQIAGYWLVLIETNRDLLISGDPDLIYPGEQLVLPPVVTDGPTP